MNEIENPLCTLYWKNEKGIIIFWCVTVLSSLSKQSLRMKGIFKCESWMRKRRNEKGERKPFLVPRNILTDLYDEAPYYMKASINMVHEEKRSRLSWWDGMVCRLNKKGRCVFVVYFFEFLSSSPVVSFVEEVLPVYWTENFLLLSFGDLSSSENLCQWQYKWKHPLACATAQGLHVLVVYSACRNETEMLLKKGTAALLSFRAGYLVSEERKRIQVKPPKSSILSLSC